MMEELRMKKKNLFVSGLSVFLILGATNVATAQDDSDDSESSPLEFEHAIVTDDFAEFADILEVIEVARAEFDGVITEFELERYSDGYYYDFEMESENEDLDIKIDAVTLDIVETDYDDDDDLDSKYRAKLNGDVYSLEEVIESTREYFDGIITDFDIDDENSSIIYEFEIQDDHLEVELDVDAQDMTIVDNEIETKDRDSSDHRDLIRQNIEDFEPQVEDEDTE